MGTPPAYLLAVFAPLWFLILLLGCLRWWKRTLHNRRVRSGKGDPESREQRWHEDAIFVVYLAFVIGSGIGFAILTAFVWPHKGDSLFHLYVRNDTRSTVTVDVPGEFGANRLPANAGIYEPDWNNDHPGVEVVRVASGGKTLGCLNVHYRRRQMHATALVSAATSCSS